MLNGYKKGQYFSFDAIIASVIFVLTLIMLLSYWNSVKTFLDFQAEDMAKEATRISTLLFVPPLPSASADCNNYDRLGLVTSFQDKRMNETVLDCLNGMDALSVRANLSALYNVSIVITDSYSPNNPYVLGENPESSDFAKTKVEITKLRRMGTIAMEDGTNHMATVDIYVYK
jgi:hypothetical protein